MNVNFIRYLLSLLMLVQNSWAIDLEQVTIKSYLNEKLKIEISIPADMAKNYEFSVASAKKYQEYGIEKPSFLNNIESNMVESDAPDLIVKINSEVPVSRPSFVLLIKETAITSEKDKLTAIPISLLLRNVSSTYEIESGDTLWSIAYKNRPGDDLTMNQMMIAIYVMNHEFFINGIDDIQAGLIDIPARDFISQFPIDEVFDENMYVRYKLLSQEVKSDNEDVNKHINQLFIDEISTEFEINSNPDRLSTDLLDEASQQQNESVEILTEVVATDNIITNNIIDTADNEAAIIIDNKRYQEKKYNVVIKTKKSHYNEVINFINEFWALMSLIALLLISFCLYFLNKYKTEKNQVMDLEKSIAMNEISTKLDLGRAYVDMGDPEGAYEILEEVLHQGDKSQRRLAKKLLDALDD